VIFTFRHFLDGVAAFAKASEREFDVAVIGSGAGGAAAALALAQRGARVMIIEAGDLLLPSDFSQREELMFPKLFYESGGRRTFDRAIRVLHGKGIGGSTLHNLNLCKRAPHEVVASWALPRFSPTRYEALCAETEALLSVRKIPESSFNRNNQIFRKGTETLGYRGGVLSHNRVGCQESGFCELGCRYDAKMNAFRVLIPKFVELGGVVLANSRAVKLSLSGKRIDHLFVQVTDPNSGRVLRDLKINAKAFVLAAGAIESPLLALRSDLPDRNQQIGAHLHLHPGAAVCGLFKEDVKMWEGIPQSYECTEFLSFDEQSDRRVWLVGGAAHPCGVAGLLPGFGDQHFEMMKLYPRMASVSPMVHDLTEGRVSEDAFSSSLPRIDYQLETSDRRQLEMGLLEAAKILFAAGAEKVILPVRKMKSFSTAAELDLSQFSALPRELDLVAVHPMGTLRMGKSPESSVTDDLGHFHLVENLWAADASLFPTSLGVPPQISIYSAGRHVGEHVIF
jgi:choline dehydrogenase-like flavoprotein